jgi:hypothetical protein
MEGGGGCKGAEETRGPGTMDRRRGGQREKGDAGEGTDGRPGKGMTGEGMPWATEEEGRMGYGTQGGTTREEGRGEERQWGR